MNNNKKLIAFILFITLIVNRDFVLILTNKDKKRINSIIRKNIYFDWKNLKVESGINTTIN